jgi:hypothetical protein
MIEVTIASATTITHQLVMCVLRLWLWMHFAEMLVKSFLRHEALVTAFVANTVQG